MGNAPDAKSRARLLHYHTRMRPQSQAGTSTFWLDVVGNWWLKAPGGGVGGAWRQHAEKWLNRGGAGQSRGVLAELVALQPLEVAQRRHSQRQGSEAPSTRRCIKT